MKIGFNKRGLTLNSKDFNPLNITVGGYGIESAENHNILREVDPFEVLSTLATAKDKGNTREDQIKVLKATLEKLEG